MFKILFVNCSKTKTNPIFALIFNDYNTWVMQTYEISRIMLETHASALLLTLTCIIKIISRISRCVAFKFSIKQ